MGIAFTNAINRHTEHACRLITTAEMYGFVYETDIHLPDIEHDDFDEVEHLLKSSDIIHFHVLRYENSHLGPLVAASMGACIIEKHITLDRNMRGPDHKISLEPFELKRLVRDIRVADQAMEKRHRFLLRGQILNRELFSKSLLAKIPIKAGTCITQEMIKVQGPGKGLSPSRRDDLIGKRI